MSEGLVQCPLCLNVMTNPVVISTGIMFDLHCVTEWFATGRTTCPVTRKKLERPCLAYPVFAMRDICSRYLVRSG